MTREQLLAALRALPATATLALPVADLREALGDGDMLLDLDVEAVAGRFGRSRSTVRSWCERGFFAGAYRLRGRAWRIPASALTEFRQAESAGRPRPARETKKADLAAWRSE